MVSPRRPPTAKATITDSEDGSMLGGHSARRKSSPKSQPPFLAQTASSGWKNMLGGPEMYRVARRALTAGLPGNRNAKISVVKPEVGGFAAWRWRLRSFTRGHC